MIREKKVWLLGLMVMFYLGCYCIVSMLLLYGCVENVLIRLLLVVIVFMISLLSNCLMFWWWIDVIEIDGCVIVVDSILLVCRLMLWK